MAEANARSGSSSGKGKAFFERAEQISETGNWDFAIELYLEGIAREPENIERGHQKLREVALKRKAQSGKGPGMVEQLKRRATKDPIESLINAEYLLAKDPGSMSYMVQVLKATLGLEVPVLTKWICDLLLDLQRNASKRNKRVLLLLIESYDKIEEYASAIQSCEMARELAPNDDQIRAAINELSAKYTIQKGGYGQEGDFTKGVRDMEKQKELAQRGAMVKDRSYLEQQIEKSRQEHLATPTVPGKISALVDALLKIEEESCENEAVDVLTKAHRDIGAYQFKMRIGDIRIRQMTRRYRKLVESGDKAGAEEQARRQLQFELEEFTERSLNYPTDLSIKYELGRRQLLAGKLDDAIASLQHAQRDPRRHARALSLLGQAFTKKQWYREAAETFERALQGELSEARTKDLRYYLGDVLEKMGDLRGAQDQFSEVAQIDYEYKDVRQRLEDLHKRIQQAPPDEEGEPKGS